VVTTTEINITKPVVETIDEIIITTETKKIETVTPILIETGNKTEKIETVVVEIHTPKN